MALKSSLSKKAFLQELDIPSLLAMQETIFAANGLLIDSIMAEQVPLAWGTFPVEFLEAHHEEGGIDIFIAADCVYEKNGTCSAHSYNTILTMRQSHSDQKYRTTCLTQSAIYTPFNR